MALSIHRKRRHINETILPPRAFSLQLCSVQPLAGTAKASPGCSAPALSQELVRSHTKLTRIIWAQVLGMNCTFLDQRRFRVGKRKIKLNSPQLVPHWVFFSKMESTLLLFSCLNNLLPGTPVKDAEMLCGRQGGLCHLLEWKTALTITDHLQFSLVLSNSAGIIIFKTQICCAVEGWKPCRQDYS